MGSIFAGIYGLIAGFIVNYLSDVLPLARKLTSPVCVHCGKQMGWVDYLTFRACRACGKNRSLRTYATLAAGVLCSVLTLYYPPSRLTYWPSLILLIYFGVVAVIDLEHRIIMHIVTLFGALLGFVIGTIRYDYIVSIVGGVVGLTIMGIFYWVGLAFARYRAKKLGHDDGEEALGFGDVLISGVLGLMLGWPVILYGLTIGVLLGGIFSLGLLGYLMITRKYETMTVFTAYGPYLLTGAVILIYFPQTLTLLLGR